MNISIGELAGRTHVKVPTIRYYEQIGLLPPPERTEGRQRRYSATEVARLSFIRHARDLGFEIDDIRELLALSARPEQPCANADEITARHLATIRDRISRLEALQAELTRMLDSCDGGCVADCRVIESLSVAAG